MTAPTWLLELGIPEQCVTRKTAVEENQRRFRVISRRGEPHEKIWSVRVDDCWLSGEDGKRVDYLFLVDRPDGEAVILLVELKGLDYKKALQQIEATLQRLCKLADGRGIHTGAHLHAPRHSLPVAGGVRAFVVLSRGHEIEKQQAYTERLRQKYGVIVTSHSRQLDLDLARVLPRSS